MLLMALTLYLVRDLWGNCPSWVIAAMFLWHYSLLMFFQAQVTIIPMAAVGVGYWAFRHYRDTLAGTVLALGIIKPEFVLVPTAVILILAIRAHRWRLIAAYGLVQLTVFGLSIALAGWWRGQVWQGGTGRSGVHEAPRVIGHATQWHDRTQAEYRDAGRCAQET